MRKLELRCFLIGLVAATTLFAVASTRAAIITTDTNLATWQAVAGSPIVLEDFTDATLQPGLTITFGATRRAPAACGFHVAFRVKPIPCP